MFYISFFGFLKFRSVFREVLKLEYAMRRVQRTETFTGMNYFSVTKTTISAMVSTTITYLIVLLQTQ